MTKKKKKSKLDSVGPRDRFYSPIALPISSTVSPIAPRLSEPLSNLAASAFCVALIFIRLLLTRWLHGGLKLPLLAVPAS
jgi:hypothetical protein